LRNKKAHDVFNPLAKVTREAARKANEEGAKKRAERIASKRGLSAEEKKATRERKASSRKWIGKVNDYLTQIYDKSKVEAADNKKLQYQIA
jgi:hypothetical protein